MTPCTVVHSHNNMTVAKLVRVYLHFFPGCHDPNFLWVEKKSCCSLEVTFCLGMYLGCDDCFLGRKVGSSFDYGQPVSQVRGVLV